MSANLHSPGDAHINVHQVINMVLHPPRPLGPGKDQRTLVIHTSDGDVIIDLYAKTDGNLAIAELC